MEYEARSQFGETFNVDLTLEDNDRVVGVARDCRARAYPLSVVWEAGLVEHEAGRPPVVVTVAGGDTLVAYDRRIDGEPLPFEREGESLAAGGSRWNPLTGEALDGPHEGRALRRANDRSPIFFFAGSRSTRGPTSSAPDPRRAPESGLWVGPDGSPRSGARHGHRA